MYYNPRPMARFTVIPRECRHFPIMRNAVALEWEFISVGFAFAAAVVTVLACFGLRAAASVTGTRRSAW
jgi:hypothetical protein